MRLALGIFHFNPHWNLNVSSSHRHCGETLAPFLRMLACHPRWRVSIHVSGIGLEFLNREYPSQLNLLRRLVEDGQVDLLSALYTPSLWIAFPRHDLIKSIETNQECLAKLGLPWSRTFYAHEMFFGAGVSTLRKYFDAAVCRDDYLSYYYDLDFTHSLFTLGGMKVIIASSHLLNEFLNYSAVNRPVLYNNHLQRVSRSGPLNIPEHFPARHGQVGNVEWLWYHCGDGNHFGTIYKPDELDCCFYDPDWATWVVRQMSSYEESGYSIECVESLTTALDYSNAKELPPLVEGGGNPSDAGGVACWMGRNNSAWENDAAILSRIMRARARVILAEQLAQSYPSSTSDHVEDTLAEAWISILRSQTSDSLGWNAGRNAVEYSLQAAEMALIKANKVLDEIALLNPEVVNNNLNRQINFPASSHNSPLPEPELFGAEGTGAYTVLSPGLVVYDCEFNPTGEVCGLKFPLNVSELVFCPSGCEDKPQRVQFKELRSVVVTLPLSNGLIQLDRDIFLVKDTFHVHLAATIFLLEGRLEYSIANPDKNCTYHWRFYVLSMSLDDAIHFANTLNASDY